MAGGRETVRLTVPYRHEQIIHPGKRNENRLAGIFNNRDGYEGAVEVRSMDSRNTVCSITLLPFSGFLFKLVYFHS